MRIGTGDGGRMRTCLVCRLPLLSILPGELSYFCAREMRLRPSARDLSSDSIRESIAWLAADLKAATCSSIWDIRSATCVHGCVPQLAGLRLAGCLDTATGL